ncbi:hypothetical protein EDD18DRAFT_1178218 [Armillaria luteobubalina]|uniref:Uncharacterized protein n=1 Tax=Armillaria luteobubalina TaxID=153913 RepID=A0AA39Q098_9AGAR|nr:hypothetical protein EDD18DRAFT_1178218 [Armillaria luteobubalina]
MRCGHKGSCCCNPTVECLSRVRVSLWGSGRTEVTRNHSVIAHHHSTVRRQELPLSPPPKRKKRETSTTETQATRNDTKAVAGVILITSNETRATRTAPSQHPSGGKSHPHYHNECAGNKKPRPLCRDTPLLSSAAGAVAAATQIEGKGSDAVLVVHPDEQKDLRTDPVQTQRAAVASKQSKTALTARWSMRA